MTLETRFPESDWRAKYFGEENLKATIPRVEKLKAGCAPRHDPARLALRFILANPVVSTTIVGMRKAEHVRGNIAVQRRSPTQSRPAGRAEAAPLGPQAAPLVRLAWQG